MSFRAYDEIKESGISWVGKIPVHWECTRLKNMFELMKRTPEADDEIVTVFRDGEVTLRLNRRKVGYTNAIQEHGYQRVLTNDLVIHAMDAFAGAIGVSDSTGKSTPVYSVCQQRDSDTDVRYYGRLLRYMALSGYINSLAKGIRERSTEFRWKESANVVVPVPPPDEQKAISSFLDVETSKIDGLVSEQRRLIELLKEKRQAVISHAVTKGLNPNAPMKPSGIEWLGDVPQHWAVPPLYTRYDQVLGKMLDQNKLTGEHPTPYIRNVDVQWDRVNSDELPIMDIKPDERDRFTIRNGDVLICEGGEVGRTAIWNGNDDAIAFQKAIHRLRPLNDTENSRYFFYTMRFATGMNVFLANSNPNTIPHLTGEQLRPYRFPKPPIDEQHLIAGFLDKQTLKFDRLQAEAQRAIELLQERRTALISAAVTGKIDVRECATAGAAH